MVVKYPCQPYHVPNWGLVIWEKNKIKMDGALDEVFGNA